MLLGSLWLAAVAAPDPSRAPASAQQEPATPVRLDQLSDAELLARLPPPERCRDKSTNWSLHPVAAELARRAENGLLSDEAWRDALRAADVFHTRALWPVGTPLQMWIRAPAWLGKSKISLVARAPDLGRIVADNEHPSGCGNCRMSQLERQRDFVLGAMPAGAQGVAVEVTIEQLREGAGRERSERTLWNGMARIPIAAVDSVEECMPPASGPEIDAAVRRCLSLQYWSTQAEPTPKATFYLLVDASKEPALSRVGVALELELLKTETVVEQLHVSATTNTTWERTPDSPVNGFCSPTKLPGRNRLVGTELERWQVRVRGDWKDALAIWEADRWWKGEFTVPLSEIMDRQPR